MGKSWLPAVFAVSLAAVTATTVGCAKKAASPPPEAAGKTTDQIMRENPEVKKKVVDSLVAQIEASNLPPDEKQRQIAKLRTEGPPP